ncbi:hypothetical protein B0H10DRAFT_474481 [Mycena sp. CBHHK59/15]|nr:hypothetical protein B0H10DRAFT_474481 [Mycena sp. CBHHK59/15]
MAWTRLPELQIRRSHTFRLVSTETKNIHTRDLPIPPDGHGFSHCLLPPPYLAKPAKFSTGTTVFHHKHTLQPVEIARPHTPARPRPTQVGVAGGRWPAGRRVGSTPVDACETRSGVQRASTMISNTLGSKPNTHTSHLPTRPGDAVLPKCQPVFALRHILRHLAELRQLPHKRHAHTTARRLTHSATCRNCAISHGLAVRHHHGLVQVGVHPTRRHTRK